MPPLTSLWPQRCDDPENRGLLIDTVATVFSSVELLSRSFRSNTSLEAGVASLNHDDAATALNMLWATPDEWG